MLGIGAGHPLARDTCNLEFVDGYADIPSYGTQVPLSFHLLDI